MGIPHLKVPFQIVDGAAAAVDQDSIDDISQSVRVLVTTPQAFRPMVSSYGVDQMIGRQSTFPVTNAVMAAVAKWESRAKVDVSTQINSYDQLIDELDIRVKSSV